MRVYDEYGALIPLIGMKVEIKEEARHNYGVGIGNLVGFIVDKGAYVRVKVYSKRLTSGTYKHVNPIKESYDSSFSYNILRIDLKLVEDSPLNFISKVSTKEGRSVSYLTYNELKNVNIIGDTIKNKFSSTKEYFIEELKKFNEVVEGTPIHDVYNYEIPEDYEFMDEIVDGCNMIDTSF